MTLVQLRYLVAIVDAGLNISVAAQNTHSTQPGLSKQLGQIEEELGFRVFTRKGKRLETLTDAGREVIERAKIILAETANIQALAASRRKDARGELRIATTLTQARYVLPETLSVLRAKFPEVTLDIAAFGESEALERVDQDAADLAIVSAPSAPRTPHLAIPLYRWELIGLVHPDHPLALQQSPITLEDLAAQPLMTYESSRSGDSAFVRVFTDRGLEPVLAATTRDSEIIKGLARSGGGIGVVAEMAWTPADADLSRLAVAPLFESRTAWAVMPRDRVLHNHVLEFLTTLAPHLDRRDLRAAFDRPQGAAWPEAPLWRLLHGPASPAAARAPAASLARTPLRLVAQA
ncbi:MAG: LysR substrate-binding domain-containing protein [Caulobacteraceae bacterium]